MKEPTSNRICCCSLRAAGYIVAFVEFLLCILAIYGLIYNLGFFGASYLFWFIVGIISVLIIFIAIIVLILAIRKNNSRWLLPHLSMQIFLILFLLIVALVVTLLLLFGAYKGIRRLIGQGDYHMSDEATRWLGFWIIIVYLAVAILEIFFLYIIYKLYLYLREYKLIASGKLDAFGGQGADVYSANWYIAPPNKHAWGGSPDAGDVYPYDAPHV